MGNQKALKYLISTKSPDFNKNISFTVLLENTFRNIINPIPIVVHKPNEKKFIPPITGYIYSWVNKPIFNTVKRDEPLINHNNPYFLL